MAEKESLQRVISKTSDCSDLFLGCLERQNSPHQLEVSRWSGVSSRDGLPPPATRPLSGL